MAEDTNKSAFAAAAMMGIGAGARGGNAALLNVRKQYANEKYHDINTVQEDVQARRYERELEREHNARMRLEEEIQLRTKEISQLKKENRQAEVVAKQKEVAELRRRGPAEDRFNNDPVAQNFVKTMDELTEDFATANMGERNVTLRRMEDLRTLIETSDAEDKEFLLEQNAVTMKAMQKEHKNRTNLAAAALNKAVETTERYMDISSLYSGFVDNNPIMMALWKLGGDAIKGARMNINARREAMARDKKNLAHAEKEKKTQLIRDQIEAERQQEIDEARQATLDIQRQTVEAESKESAKFIKDRENLLDDGAPDYSDFDDSDGPVSGSMFSLPDDEYSGTGDAAMDIGSFFDGIPSDDDDNVVTIDPTKPIPTFIKETEEQKAMDRFIQQDAEHQHRVELDHHIESIQHQVKIFSKLEDIESAILDGNTFAKENPPEGGGGFLAFGGQLIAKLANFLAPIAAGVASVLGAIGLGKLGDKLLDGVDNLSGDAGTERKKKRHDKKLKKGKGGKLSRLGKGAGRLAGRGLSLLGSGAALGAAGYAGWEAGGLINDHVLDEDTKIGIGDTIGPWIDHTLDFFGSEDAKRRLEMQKINSGKTLGVDGEPKPKDIEAFMRENSDSALIKIDTVNNHKTSINRGQVEVPMQAKTEKSLHAIETKVNELNEARAQSSRPAPPMPAPRPTTQNVVKSGGSDGPASASSRGARNTDSSIQRITDRMVSYSMT